MAGDARHFYDELADHYHLIFENWEASITRQAEALAPILKRERNSSVTIRILDCACGIGTQALGLAKRGFAVTASDLSPTAVARLRLEASQRGHDIHSFVADMVDLNSIPESNFDAVICMDNSLPHLESDELLVRALRQMRMKLRPHGVLMASVRDYDRLVDEQPAVQGPAFYQDNGSRRIVVQVWDWLDEHRYVFHLFITRETANGWQTFHSTAGYRAIKRDELTNALNQAGFTNVRWLFPTESGFYQPIVLAQADGTESVSL
jgi:glycine/sarcosine N-methyltransferase